MMSDADMIIELGDQLAAMCDSVDDLKRQLSAEREAREKAEEALTPKPLPEGLVPHAYQLAATIQNAEYWYKAGHKEKEVGKAVMCMAQAMFAWKNAALAKAEDAMTLKQRAESAEQRIREAQEQEPVGEVASDFITAEIYARLPMGAKLYAATIPPADVAELQRENEMLREQAEVQVEIWNKLQRENEELTRKLAGWQLAHRHLYEICFEKEMPEGFVPEEELTKLLEEAKRQAVPEEVIQAEIVKRLGEPVAIVTIGGSGVHWMVKQEDVPPYPTPLYRLPSPLATPEEND